MLLFSVVDDFHCLFFSILKIKIVSGEEGGAYQKLGLCMTYPIQRYHVKVKHCMYVYTLIQTSLLSQHNCLAIDQSLLSLSQFLSLSLFFYYPHLSLFSLSLSCMFCFASISFSVSLFISPSSYFLLSKFCFIKYPSLFLPKQNI